MLERKDFLEQVLARNENSGFEEDVRLVDAAIGLPPGRSDVCLLEMYAVAAYRDT